MDNLETKIEEDYSTRYIIGKSENILDNDYLFGCEFEFYPKEGVKIEDIITELSKCLETDLLFNPISVPKCEDSSNCMHLKPDISLESNGLEISIPISSYSSLLRYIQKINELINQFGYTNNDTGLHIHISTCQKNGINLNFYKFSLLCNKENLLNSWYSRNAYCLNVMEVINYNNKKEAKKLKEKKGRVWNLELISRNRIEIRTIGGTDYHLETDKILQEIKKFKEIFEETLCRDTKEFEILKNKHFETVKKATPEEKIGFIKLFKLDVQL